MRIAIIDLGTNTFNLLVVDVTSKDKFKSIFSTKVAVKLGEGGINKKLISSAAFQRGISGLKTHRAIIDKLKAEKIIAFATSAIRDASNSRQFMAAAKKEANIDIQIISGEREAQLIYEGVRMALNIGTDASLILDIGGGSNEFIIATQETALWKQSFDIGIARLLDQFRPGDPISASDIQKLEGHFRAALQPLFEAVKEHPVKELIGSSGSFDTFAEMIAHKFHSISDLRGKTEFVFKMDEYETIHKHLLASTKKERIQTPGLIELRVDMIVIGTILVSFILKELGITKMRMSTYALKQGVLADVMSKY